MSSEHKLQYETQGLVHLKDALESAFLARLRTAFESAIEKHPAQPERGSGVRNDKAYFDIPSILDEDDAFVDLIDVPTVFPLLTEILGTTSS